MISTTYSTETAGGSSSTHHHHRTKSIHLSAPERRYSQPSQSQKESVESALKNNNNVNIDNDSTRVPSTSSEAFSGFTNASTDLHPTSHNHHHHDHHNSASHAAGRKKTRQRGLSISTGVSYTNFYAKVGNNTPDQNRFLFSPPGYKITGNGKIMDGTKFDLKLASILERINFKIIFLCAAWYLSSVLSSNLTKSILKIYKYPVTLTEIQFLLTSMLCFITYVIVFSNPKIAHSFPLGTFPIQLTEKKFTTLHEIIKPTRLILTQTVPMGMFQFIGHITSHNATSLIPVSMVHTIKALSPIVTVLSYRLLFQVKYPTVTYLTLIPLMVGIMLTCLFKNHKKSSYSSSTSTNSHSLVAEKSAYLKGLVYAFISMLIFVSQNIFAKKILTYKTNLLASDNDYSAQNGSKYSNILPVDKEEETTIKKINEKKKVDKLTILFYCSIIGFAFTFPIYLSSEFFSNSVFSLLMIDSKVFILMMSHGLVHFIQSLLAFHILGLISPVSYSIANIFKRIVVIFAALIWEAQPLNAVQGLGLVLTMVGLYCYDRWGGNKKH